MRGKLYAVHAYVPVPIGLAAPASVASQLEVTVAAEARARLDRELQSTHIPAARRFVIGRHPIDAIQIAARQEYDEWDA